MVLVVEGEKRLDAATDVESATDWLLSLPSMEQSSSTFHGRKESVSSEADLLYVHQGEVATLSINPIDLAAGRGGRRLPSCVASDDVTSCLLIVVHSRKTCAIAHMDTPARVVSFFNHLRGFFNHLDDKTASNIFLVGSVNDMSKPDRRVLLTTIAHMLYDQGRDYVIRLCCVEKLNTVWRVCSRGPRQGLLINYPISTGLIYNWRTGTVTSCNVRWSARGPVPVLRLARLRATEAFDSVVPVFDSSKCSLVINPFGTCAPLCNPESLTEEVMRSYSTTPDQEPVTYFEGCRAVASLIARYPHGSFWFPEGRPLMFSPNDLENTGPCESYWIPADASSTFAHTHSLTTVRTKSGRQ